MKEICLNRKHPSYMDSSIYLHLFPLRARVICPIDRPAGLPRHRCTYLCPPRSLRPRAKEKKERKKEQININKKKNSAFILSFLSLTVPPRVFSRSYGAVSRERVYESCLRASPPVFSRPRRPPRPVSLSVLRKPPAASAQECMKSVTAPRRNLPFESTWTPFTVIRCLPPKERREKRKREKCSDSHRTEMIPFRPFLSRLLLLATIEWPVCFLRWPRTAIRGRSLFIRLRILKI